MANEIFEHWTKLGSATYRSLKELAAINTRALKKLSAQQQAILTSCLEVGSDQFYLTIESKAYEDILPAQSKLVAKFGEKLLATAREINSVLEEAQVEFAAWIEKGMDTAIEPLNKVHEIYKKAA